MEIGMELGEWDGRWDGINGKWMKLMKGFLGSREIVLNPWKTVSGRVVALEKYPQGLRQAIPFQNIVAFFSRLQ